MNKITLNIGEEDRVFHFGLGFLGNLLESEDVPMESIDAKLTENPFKWIPLIMYYSCAFGYIRNNQVVPFSKYDVAEWIDKVGMNNEVVTNFFTAFRVSLTKDVPQEPTKENEVKKK